jgi:hypothetical protein
MSENHASAHAFYAASSLNSRDDETSIEAAVPAAIPTTPQATRLPLQRCREAGFTLAELLVSVGVLLLVVLLATQLLNSASNHYDLGSQANGRGLTSATVA